MSIEFLCSALFVVSILTNLTVQGIKNIKNKKNEEYSANALAAVTSVIISAVLSAVYLIWTETSLDGKIVVEVLALMYFSFLSATVGYDKVIQGIKQMKEKKANKTAEDSE